MAERVYVFLLLRREGRNERVIVWDTQDITVGREPGNDVVVDEPEMSRQHARFRKDGQAFVIDSLSTSNATEVNGEVVSSQPLRHGDVVGIAGTELVFYRSVDNPVTLGLKCEYASQLKDCGPKIAGDGEATILGLTDTLEADEDFEVQPAGAFDPTLADGSAPAPRNLDLELAEGLEDLDMPGEAASGRLSLTLELDGLSPELARLLKGLLGKTVELPALRVRIKGDDLG